MTFNDSPIARRVPPPIDDSITAVTAANTWNSYGTCLNNRRTKIKITNAKSGQPKKKSHINNCSPLAALENP